MIKAISGGDRRAMHMLYARHNVKIYRFILRLIKNASLAEDLVSEVFMSVWRDARALAISAMRRRCDEQLDDEALVVEDPADNPHILRRRGIAP